jgi:hypothetical protein
VTAVDKGWLGQWRDDLRREIGQLLGTFESVYGFRPAFLSRETREM